MAIEYKDPTPDVPLVGLKKLTFSDGNKSSNSVQLNFSLCLCLPSADRLSPANNTIPSWFDNSKQGRIR